MMYTRWQLDASADPTITLDQQQRAWANLRQLCRELDLDVPNLGQIRDMEAAFNAPAASFIPTEGQVICFSRLENKLVCLDLNVGCVTGDDVTNDGN